MAGDTFTFGEFSIGAPKFGLDTATSGVSSSTFRPLSDSSLQICPDQPWVAFGHCCRCSRSTLDWVRATPGWIELSSGPVARLGRAAGVGACGQVVRNALRRISAFLASRDSAQEHSSAYRCEKPRREGVAFGSVRRLHAVCCHAEMPKEEGWSGGANMKCAPCRAHGVKVTPYGVRRHNQAEAATQMANEVSSGYPHLQ